MFFEYENEIQKIIDFIGYDYFYSINEDIFDDIFYGIDDDVIQFENYKKENLEKDLYTKK